MLSFVKQMITINRMITVAIHMNTDNNVQVGVRLPPNTMKKIDRMVERGDATNRSDAIRSILRKATEGEE